MHRVTRAVTQMIPDESHKAMGPKVAEFINPF